MSNATSPSAASPAGPLRICIAGAGAIGGTLAVRLSAAGHQVSVLARGQTLQAIRERGLTLHDLHGTTHARPAASQLPEFGMQDVIFLCAKSQDMSALLPQIAPMVGEETVVIPTNNGVPWWYFHREGGRFDGQAVKAVDPDGALSNAVALDRLIGSVLFITAEVESPGVIRSVNPHLMVLGEPSGEMSGRLMRVRAAVEAAGIEARATDRIRDKLWTKIIANISTNPLSVITQGTLQQLYGLPELREVVSQIMRETLLVASSHGARVDIDPLTFLQLGEAMGAFRTSMLQDLERGRPLELAAIGDAVLEMAERYAIPMPITRAIVSLARFRGEAAQQQTGQTGQQRAQQTQQPQPAARAA
ncbi:MULTISPECIES: ketopantoate reductase family protein [Herbaspirillum]|uniref:2-dehydropantoate 2-reductase n=2 Tax=Pseudomonadota TaxID=1224 RepID=A0ABU2EL95_9BURK|nr:MULTISPECIES: 2-dehydropantoate 2-reductase [Herbaspirillum]MDR6740775.1 2-dehydropantoate 2-reductase [Herbaspirillum sp. 1173]MDR9848884.1 2-dehydropantoate 2-reductase [Herbaspirillum huttiense SE1]